MISGRRGTYYTAFAVLAAALATVAVMLAAPAWSKDAQTGKNSEQTGEATAEKSLSPANNKTSGKNSGGTEEKTTQKSSSQNKSKAAGTDPIEGAGVEVQEDKGAQGKVDNGDVLVINGNYKVSSGASVTLEDGDGTQGKFVDGDNAHITVGSVQINVTGDPKDVSGGDDELNTTDLTVVSSTGVQSAGNNNKSAKSSKKKGGKHHHHGHKHNSTNINDCTQILEQTNGGSGRQYNSADQTQNCIINKAKRKGGGGGNANEATVVTVSSNQYPNDLTIAVATQPEGQVLDTSALSQLPFTGGPNLTGAALVAGLALLGVGAGVSVWRLRGGDERGDD